MPPTLSTLDLVLHDWGNLSQRERETAIEDIRALATTFGDASPHGAGRRARSLNIVASLLTFAAPGKGGT